MTSNTQDGGNSEARRPGGQVSESMSAPGDAPPVSSTPGEYRRDAELAETQADAVAMNTDAPVVATNEPDTIPAASRFSAGEPPSPSGTSR